MLPLMVSLAGAFGGFATAAYASTIPLEPLWSKLFPSALAKEYARNAADSFKEGDTSDAKFWLKKLDKEIKKMPKDKLEKVKEYAKKKLGAKFK